MRLPHSPRLSACLVAVSLLACGSDPTGGNPPEEDTTAPTAPSGLTATAQSPSAIGLTWTASTDNNGVAGYVINRDGVPVDTTTATSYTDNGLAASTNYTYSVVAFDAAGNVSAASNNASATTLAPPDATAPSTPANLSATAQSPTDIGLNWGASTDNVGVTGYHVFRGSMLIDSTADTTYTDTGLSSGSTYSYRVSAYDAAGNESAQSDSATATTMIAADTTAPSVPAGLAASATSATSVTVSWNSSTDDTGVTGYQVLRGGVMIDSVADTTYADAGLTASTTYSYRVTAYDAAGNVSAQSDSATATTPAASDTTAPSMPVGLAAVAVSSSAIDLTWNQSTDNVGVTGYQVFRGGVMVDSVADTTYADTGLTASTTYTYRVAAFDAAGNVSAQSDSATATTPAGGGGGLSCSSVTVLCVDDAAGAMQEFVTIQAASDAAGPGDTVWVQDGTYIGFRAATSGTPGTPVLFLAAGSNVLIDADGPTDPDGIRLQNVNYVTVDGFTVRDVTERCVAARGASAAVPMRGNVVRNITCSNSSRGGMYFSQFSNGLIENNTIFDIPCVGGAGCKAYGIYLSNAGTDSTTVRGNIITNTANEGIHHNGDINFGGDGLITGLLIENNIIGPVGSNGLNMDGVQSSTIRNNIFYGMGRNAIRVFQIDAAAGAKDLTIINNTMLASVGTGWSIKLTADQGGHVIFNNVLLGKGIAVENSSFVSGNNVGSNVFSLDGDNTTISLSAWQAAGYGANSILANLVDLFVNDAANDYHLKTGSPAIDAGINMLSGVAAPSTDLEGTARPQGAAYDAGAYEK